jgi:hypothetical protein
MKSFLQSIALVSAILFIVSCDSGGTSGVTNVPITPPQPPADPEFGIDGRAVKGVVGGGTITVTDSAGADVAIASGGTTGADGSYTIIFDQAEVSAPIVVTVAGGDGATMVCDIDLAGTDDDCAVGDGTSVAFGESYPLPETFALRGLVAEVPTEDGASATVNITPASDLATNLALASADTSALTAADVEDASSQVLGLIQTITGTDLSGQDLNDIAIPDVADSADAAAASESSLALAAFSAAIIANQGDGETVGDVIARVNSSLTADADGNLAASGTELSSLTNSVVTALTTVSAQVTAGGGDSSAVDAAVDNAEAIEEVYETIGDEDVSVPPVPEPDSTAPADQTKAFISTFSNVVSSALATTGAAGAGGDGQSATELFATELDAVAALNSGPATAASRALQDAVNAAVADLTEDDTVTIDNESVSFSLTKAGTVFSIADASSTQTSADGTVVVISATTGTSEGAGVFSLEGVTMVTTTPGAAQGDDPVTTQTFTAGTLTGAVVDGNTVTEFVGTVTGGVATTSFGLSITYFERAGDDAYAATIDFNSATSDELILSVSGTVGQDIGSYAVTAGGDTIAFTATPTAVGTGTVVFSDGTVLMTLSLESGSVVEDQAGNIAVLTVAGVETGTVSANGTVTYSDGSIQSLPAGIF